jgi:hypothetical protein
MGGNLYCMVFLALRGRITYLTSARQNRLSDFQTLETITGSIMEDGPAIFPSLDSHVPNNFHVANRFVLETCPSTTTGPGSQRTVLLSAFQAKRYSERPLTHRPGYPVHYGNIVLLALGQGARPVT